MFDTIRGGRAYGPYLRKDGRKHIIINYPLQNGTFSRESRKETVSYPKWLMEQTVGRVLDPDSETIDHIDRNLTNDQLNNLQILPRSTHAALDANRRTPLQVECVWCFSKFIILVNRTRTGSEKAGPFCSSKCSGQYGAEVQNNRISKLQPMTSQVNKYYKLDK